MLVDFIKSLLETGELEVDKEIIPFTESDLEISSEVLTHYFDHYKIQFPDPNTISYHKQVGVWAASYIYRLCQTLVLRDLSEEAVQKALPDYQFGQTIDEVLSVDLMFQYIPDIYELSKLLSPSDIVTLEVKNLADQWPISLIEISENPEINHIENNPRLLAIYCDKIIQNKQLKAVRSPIIKDAILAHLGDYQNHFWKELKELTNDE